MTLSSLQASGRISLRRPLRVRGVVLPLLLSVGCSVAASAPAAALNLKANEQGPWMEGVKAITIGAIALGAAAAGLVAVRRRYAGNFSGHPQTMAPWLKSSRRISQKTVLLVVQWEGRVYLLAENAQATQLLDSRSLEGESS